MALSETDKLIIISILSIVAAVVMYFEWRWMRSKRVGKKIVESASKKDQAFNSLLTTKAVRDKLRSQHLNTMKADYMIDSAQDSFDNRVYDSCIDTCARAREELYKCRQEGNVTLEPTKPARRARTLDEIGLSDDGEKELKIPPRPKDDPSLPAKFEFHTAKDALDCYAGSTETRDAAAALISQAEKALESKDYTKTLSCSFKAKKLLSDEPVEEKDEHLEKIVLSKPVDAGHPRCLNCGSLIEPEDTFCASCGTPVGERKCTSCGAKLKPNDKFCRKCGTKT